MGIFLVMFVIQKRIALLYYNNVLFWIMHMTIPNYLVVNPGKALKLSYYTNILAREQNWSNRTVQ